MDNPDTPRRPDRMAPGDDGATPTVRDAFAGRAGRRWRVAETLYTAAELATVPPSVVETALGLGNPVRDAQLQPGECVLDIGCGTGIDTILAARAVDPVGRVIGLDITPEIIAQARAQIAACGLANVELLAAPMEAIPLPDAAVDVIISNGVLNLSTDKDRAFAEAYRVLRPGGRMVAADMLLAGHLPAGVADNPKLWSG